MARRADARHPVIARLDAAVEARRAHGPAPAHYCADCEVELLRATLALIGEALVSGHLIYVENPTH